jgi:hypothetical protein
MRQSPVGFLIIIAGNSLEESLFIGVIYNILLAANSPGACERAYNFAELRY